jgi:hypothetical protein
MTSKKKCRISFGTSASKNDDVYKRLPRICFIVKGTTIAAITASTDNIIMKAVLLALSILSILKGKKNVVKQEIEWVQPADQIKMVLHFGNTMGFLFINITCVCCDHRHINDYFFCINDYDHILNNCMRPHTENENIRILSGFWLDNIGLRLPVVS